MHLAIHGTSGQYLQVAEVLLDQYILRRTYDACELGRRRRLEMGRFLQLGPSRPLLDGSKGASCHWLEKLLFLVEVSYFDSFCCTFGILSSCPGVNLPRYCWGCTDVRCCQSSVLWAFAFCPRPRQPSPGRDGPSATDPASKSMLPRLLDHDAFKTQE